MPKGKDKSNGKIPAHLTTVPKDLHPSLFQFSSIVALARTAHKHSIFNKFYIFRCEQGINHGDDLAASQIFNQLKHFANTLDTRLLKKPNDLEITAKLRLIFTKLKLAYVMARNEKLKSEIANYYFFRLDSASQYTIKDNEEINVFSNHLMSQLPTIDAGTNTYITQPEKRLMVLSCLETLRQKSRNIIGTTLVSGQISMVISMFKKESIIFQNEAEQQNYEAKLIEHELKLTQEPAENQKTNHALVPSALSSKERERCTIS